MPRQLAPFNLMISEPTNPPPVTSTSARFGGELFIGDNSDTAWKGLK